MCVNAKLDTRVLGIHNTTDKTKVLIICLTLINHSIFLYRNRTIESLRMLPMFNTFTPLFPFYKVIDFYHFSV